MADNVRLQTGISTACWCTPGGEFKPAEIGFGNQKQKQNVSWFDRLFENGIQLPAAGNRPLTFLIMGPPGSGKTTLALEFCYRLASDANNGMSSVFISTDTETDRLISNAKSFGWERVGQFIFKYGKKDKAADGPRLVRVWGKEQIQSFNTLAGIVQAALETIEKRLKVSTGPFKGKADDRTKREPVYQVGQSFHDVVVVDSLNIVEPELKGDFFEQFLKVTSEGTRIVTFILDSSDPGQQTHMFWEYACDIVLRLDYSCVHDYYVRTIEVVKARYQPHVWGKHQLKIYQGPERHDAQGTNVGTAEQRPRADMQETSDGVKPRRDHPYRREGGIAIFPSIHYYLSLYKRHSIMEKPDFVQTYPPGLGKIVRLPKGRCTAFVGHRGGHKSHLGYLHLLHALHKEKKAGGLVISLRDDEEMAKTTMNKILQQEFGENDEGKIDEYEGENRLEVLYYPPGYITPEEFFHRMFMSIHRLKMQCDKEKLTVLFNSLDQLSARFPLCAKQEIFIPGIIEALSGEGITSIFIAVDEPGQPPEQYGLLQMADLIISFHRHKFDFRDYHNHLDETWDFKSKPEKFRNKVRRVLEEYQRATHEAVVLQVERFAGGEKAGARGILEFIDGENLEAELYEKPGLHFTELSPRYAQGEYLAPR